MLSLYIYKEGASEENHLYCARSTVKYGRRSSSAKLELEPGFYKVVPDVRKEEALNRVRQNSTTFSLEQTGFPNYKRSVIAEGKKPAQHQQEPDKDVAPSEKLLGRSKEMQNTFAVR